MKLSVIIPVYNVEAYIEKCVLSIEKQDIPVEEFEIIIINDGSPDNSKAVILSLTRQFNNIVFIDQENKGVSAARNAGIDRATGEYLLFIDPDDYIAADCFSGILKTAFEADTDIFFLGYQFLNADNSLRKEIAYPEAAGKIYQGIQAYQVSRGDGTTDPDRAWAVLYKKTFMNNSKLRFLANVPYLEDGELIARILCLAERCIFSGKAFYFRTTRQGSATNSNMFFSEKAIAGFFKAAGNLKEFKKRFSLNESQILFINQPIVKFTLLIVQACTGRGNFSKYKAVKEKLKMNGLDQLDTRGCNALYKKYGRLYNISPDLFYMAWSARLMFLSVYKKLPDFTKKSIQYQ